MKLTKLKTFFFTAAGIMIGIAVMALFTNSTSDDDLIYTQNYKNNYRVFAVPIDMNMDFAGEKVPMHDIELRERIDRELLINDYFQSSTLQYIKRVNRFFPIIEPILKQYNVPDDFKYLAVIESGLQNVSSPAAASGFWQILKPTAQSYGLEVNEFIDERYNLEMATAAACQYFIEAKGRFGSWALVAASYNMGMAGLQAKIDEQGQNNYYDLHLNTETSRYLPRLLAVKAILKNPQAYGFYYRSKDLYFPLKAQKITVTQSIDDLAQYAIDKGINYKYLRYYNPWLRGNKLPVKMGKSYILLLPFTDDVRKGSIEVKDQPIIADLSPEKNIDNTDFIKYYTIEGDNISLIAKRFNVKPQEIVAWNNLPSANFALPEGTIILVKKK